MRLLILSIILFSFFSCSVKSQKNLNGETLKTEYVTKIYLVRHAEKEKDGTKDPSLNAAGKERALELASILGTARINKIYSTDYKRTKMTGQPLAKQLNEDIEIYEGEDEIVFELENITGNVLVIGHSNTIPRLINRLINKEQLKDLDENEYDKLFVIDKRGKEYELKTQTF